MKHTSSFSLVGLTLLVVQPSCSTGAADDNDGTLAAAGTSTGGQELEGDPNDLVPENENEQLEEQVVPEGEQDLPQEEEAIDFETPLEDEMDGCEREVKLEAVTVTTPEPFDVLIVADHSGSLSWSKDELSAGLQNFLGQIRGHDARFYVLTPTQYGARSEESNSPLTGGSTVAWQDPATLVAYTNEMTSYSETCTDLQGQTLPCPTYPDPLTTNLTLQGRWDFEMPEPVAVVTPEMDDAAIDTQGQAIADAILGLGLGGSSDEQPVCTLNRYIQQEPDALPENAVFLVLSDEDDVSDPARCVVEQQIDVTVDGAKRVFELPGSGMNAARKFNCTPLDDQGQATGTPIPAQWNLGTCTASRECSASDLQAATDQCPVNHVMSDCRVECVEELFVLCRVDETEQVQDACNSAFTLDGTTYGSIVEYCSQRFGEATGWGTCTNYLRADVAIQTINQVPLLPNMTLTEMGQEFRRRADVSFGTAGYSVELIAFAPEFSCAPMAGQSYAEELRTLVDSAEHVFPICEDYSGALGKVRDFARQLLQTEYALRLQAEDDIAAVRIIDAQGTSRALDPSEFTYDAPAGLLRLEPSTLNANDRGLELDVLGACVIR